MAEPYLSEIRVFAFNFAPKGWATCDGQILPINQNQALFSLLGTTYGGNGTTTFALPDLRGRTLVHAAPQMQLGQVAGVESSALPVQEIPLHTHTLQAASQPAEVNTPGANALASAAIYAAPENLTPMNSNVLASPGNSAHSNMQPSLVVNFCIALTGVFPSRN